MTGFVTVTKILSVVGAARRRLSRALRLPSLLRALDGDPLAFDGQVADPLVASRVRAEQLNNVARNTSVMMLATSLNAMLFAFVMRESPRAHEVWIWALAVVGLCGYMYAKRKQSRRPLIKHASARGVRLAIAYALLHGSLWGVLPAFFFIGSTTEQQFTVVCLCIGMLSGGAFALSSIPMAMIAYVTPIIAGSILGIAMSSDPVYNVVGVFLGVFSFVLFSSVRSWATNMARRCVAEVEAEEGASRDNLTQLPNRASFHDALAVAFARHERMEESFAVMCFDLDCFKGINDTLGHAAGDQVLVETARRLKEATRDVDIVARVGGDEFALIATNIRTKKQAVAVAERIVTAFREPFIIDGATCSSTISVGVALAPVDGADADTLLRNADSALYATKHSGRSGFTFFRDRFDFVGERASLEAELDRALANSELYLVFQPFVNVATLRTTGFEALLRWRHPTRGVLSAAEIIPLFERGGLIDEVGVWVMEEAIAIAAAWPEHLRLAVNVSALQLCKPNLESAIRRALAAHHFDAHRLEIELTESARIADVEGAVAMLNSLEGLGVGIALDDLGTGYSTLTSLVELPLDRLKIDRSFVANIDVNPMCASVVKISIELARALALNVTAEGVEDERQLEFLRAFGCAEAQGYLFSRPVTAEELPRMYFRCEPGRAEAFEPAALAS